MYAVISDIHGNLDALEAVLRDVPEEVETIYCLGDVIGYGANPNECCDIVRELGIPTISGNRDHLSRENADFLRTRPRMMQSDDALFVHGSVRDPDEYIINRVSAEENLAILRSDYPEVGICFFGHTHVKAVAPSPNGAMVGGDTLDLRYGGPYLVNPGSVGQPRDGDAFASYVICDGERLLYRYIEYDIKNAQDKIRAAGLPNMLADRLAVGR
jgi:predicted phosphodiesterase